MNVRYDLEAVYAFSASQLPLMEMETTLLRGPVENMRINLKKLQSSVEKALVELADKQATGSIDRDTLREELNRVAQEASQLANRQNKYCQELAVRQRHFEQMEAAFSRRQLDPPTFRAAVEQSLDVAIVNHCVEHGRIEAAKEYINEKQVGELIDQDILQEAGFIINDLHAHKTESALQWCIANRSFLKKRASSLEPDLRTHEVMRLLAQNKVHEAVAYSRKHMTRFALYYPGNVSTIANVLIGVQTDTFQSKDSWDRLRESFLHEYMEYRGQSSPFTLLVRVGAGLAALRTRSCGQRTNCAQQNPLDAEKVSMCPACSDTLGPLAELVPYAHHVHSILPPDPVMLPNFRVYSRAALEDFSRQQHCWPDIVDPLSREVFGQDALTKIYPT